MVWSYNDNVQLKLEQRERESERENEKGGTIDQFLTDGSEKIMSE